MSWSHTKWKNIRDRMTNDNIGNMKKCILCFGGKKKRKNIKKKHERKDKTLQQYIQRLLRPSASKDTKHKNTANMHHQWKLTVNKVAMTQPRYHTDQYVLTASLKTQRRKASITSLFQQHTQTRTVANDVTVTVQTPMRTDKRTAYSTHSQ